MESTLLKKFSWYPGHIAKAEKELRAKLKLIDLVIELRDARIPFSSAHKDLDKWAGSKKIIVVMSKLDLADPQKLKRAIADLEDQYADSPNYLSKVFAIDIKSKSGLRALTAAIENEVKHISAKYTKVGVARPTKIVVVGYPNVGKSSLINLLARAKKTKVENRPGVTKQQQWVDIKSKLNIKLLDTPGIIPPKLYSAEQAMKLALCQCLGDKAFESYEVAKYLLSMLDPQVLSDSYGVGLEPGADELLIAIAKARVLLDKGEADLLRVSELLINDWRKLKFGPASLE